MPVCFRSLLCLIAGVLICRGAFANEPLPLPLQAWSNWVLKGEDQRACPLIASRAAREGIDFVCAWTAPLNLRVDASSARFSFGAKVYVESTLELPGDAQAWPVAVTANGKPIAVVERAGKPVIRLPEGTYELSGELAFATRPERLALPELIAAVELDLDGQRVARIRREDGMLWLGQLEREATQADALAVEVFRRIDDELPMRQTLALKVDVAGRAREVSFEQVLGADFVPTQVRSALPAQINERGDLKVKLEPGSFFIFVDGRALIVDPALTPLERAAPWPTEEIYSYAANGRVRVSQASGTRPIDANTLNMPDDWKALPAFVLGPKDKLEIEETARGRLSDTRNSLSLNRTAWLRFDGSEWRFRDNLSGSMTRDFRVDLNPPLKLLSARIGEEDRLITAGAKPQQRGVEIREGSFTLNADSSLASPSRELPVGAWDLSLDNASWTLNLPPGYRLLHASGASRAPGTWLERFSLLDVFLILLALVLLRRALGTAVAAAALLFFTVAYHENSQMALLLALLSGLLLIERALPDNLLKRFAVGFRWLLLGLLALAALGFAVAQIRLALYPQLEAGAMSYGQQQWASNAGQMVQDAAMAPMPAAPAATENIEITGSRMDKSNALQSNNNMRSKLNRYAQDVVVQAGVGMPNWQWQGYSMGFQGPVTADQFVRLWISPAWATRLGRLLALFGLGFVLAGFLRQAGIRAKPLAASTASLLGVLLLMPLATPLAQAQALPTPELLAELKTRLIEPPACAPLCADLAKLSLSATGNTVTVDLELHAQTLSAVPLPTFADGWQPASVEVDGARSSYLARDGSGLSFIALGAGVHRVRLSGSLANMDRFKLALPLKPRALDLNLAGWSALGLRDGVLLSANLEVVRDRSDEARGAESESARSDRLLPFVRVTRRFDFGSDFTIATEITRVAPAGESINLKLPLLAGEQVLSGSVAVNGGQIEVVLPGDQNSLSFNSRLPRSAKLALSAGPFSDRAETWILAPGDEWRIAFDGTPALESLDPEQAFVYEFRPRPQEKLVISLSRPEAIRGTTLALDEVSLGSSIGAKAQDHHLKINYRATRSQQHTIGIPQGLELLRFASDGAVLPIRVQDGKLGLPITPGAHTIELEFREIHAVGWRTKTPAFDLKMPSANINLHMSPPADRWTLLASGPALGVAVLYWGELLFALLFAVVIARLKLTPLGTVSWLLLVLGFSTWSWVSLLIVVVWLHALSMRPRFARTRSDGVFNLVQIALAVLTLIALAAIVLSIPLGLLGDPDMHVVGYGSSAGDFRWFADHAAGVLPVAGIYSLPKWIYQLLMLSFALWLAVALSSWLKWGYRAFAEHGLWRQTSEPQAPPLPQTDSEPTRSE